MRTIELEGSQIKSLSDFYDQIEAYLSLGECPWGRNLDSLDENVIYNFNYTEDKGIDVNKVIWRNSELSKQYLASDERQDAFDILVEILSDNEALELVLA